MERRYREAMPSEPGPGRVRVAQVRPADVLLALVVSGLAVVEIWVEPIFDTGIPGPRIPLTVIVVALAVPLALRRRWPLPTLVGYSAGLLAVAVVGDPDQSAFELFLGVMLMVYALAVREPIQRAVLGAVVALGVGGVTTALTYSETDAPADIAVPALLFGATWAVGREVRHQRERAASLERRAAVAERVQEDRVAAATAAERSRIARELHDVVAHGVSQMGLQASGVRSALADTFTAEREALRSIEDTGRSTLDELHRMLGVLRSVEDVVVLSPAPTLDRLPELCERMTGPPAVSLRYDGAPRPLPAGLELSAYRIVQEALTNAHRHSGADTVQVRVAYGDERLVLRVCDDGRGAPERWESGHGLVGMRERVAVHRGELDVMNHPGRGFEVLATLPIGAP